jgi:hypothetical protein
MTSVEHHTGTPLSLEKAKHMMRLIRDSHVDVNAPIGSYLADNDEEGQIGATLLHGYTANKFLCPMCLDDVYGVQRRHACIGNKNIDLCNRCGLQYKRS